MILISLNVVKVTLEVAADLFIILAAMKYLKSK